MLKNKDSKNGIISMAFLAVFLGLLAGIAGSLISNEYMTQNLYGIPFGNNIDLSYTGLNNPNLIIKDAKNITVEQEKKIEESIKSSSGVMVGLFEKKEEVEEGFDSESIDINDFYNMDNNLAQGIIITSDGWIVMENFITNQSEAYVSENYVIIDKNKDVYEIDKIKSGDNDQFLFLKIKEGKQLPVKKLSPEREIRPGNWVLAMDWSGKTYLSSIIDKTDNRTIRSSDSFNRSINLANDLNPYFESSFIFDLKGGIVGLYSRTNDSYQSINNFRSTINSILKEGGEELPYFGANYVYLEKLIIDEDDFEKGALIYPDETGVAVSPESSAENMGLRAGDVIISLNNQDIKYPDQGLNYLLQQYSPGDRISISYIREGEVKTVTDKLQGIKQ